MAIASIAVSLVTVVNSRVTASIAPRTLNRPRPEGPRINSRAKAPQVAQGRPVDEMGGVDEADHPLEPPGLLQPRPGPLVEELGLLVGVGLGRDHAEPAELQADPLEELADLDRPTPDAGEPLDGGGRLGGRPGRVLAEVLLDRLAMVGQLAGRPVPVGLLEPLDAALLVLPEVRSQGVLADPGHRQLDMSFGEDRSRVRKDHADANMAALRRLALGLLKNEATKKVGIKNKRLVAAGNIDYLRQVLFGA